MLPADNHVHSQWSWDTGSQASMTAACEQAIAAGLPAVAFTEHLDFSRWGPGDQMAAEVTELNYRGGARPLDVDGYIACIEECRDRFPQVRVLSGVELGEPHLFAGSIASILKLAPFDRILGSLHAVLQDGKIFSVNDLLNELPADQVVRLYFAELLRLVAGSSVFQVLAHVDFPRRYWPHWGRPFAEQDYEEEYRAVFTALAGSDRALEINTRSPLASVELLRWWKQQGGRAVSFGSDAHLPYRVGEKFELAVAVVEAAGFKPGRDQFDFWRA